MKRSRAKRMRTRNRKGGAMPYQYVQPGAPLVSAGAGRDMENGSGLTIRNRIGGGSRHRRQGGFVPSVMEGFVAASSKYITPMALFAAYKLVKRPTKHRKGKKQSARRR